MDYRLLIKNSWILTRKHKSLIRLYAFAPAILTTLVGIVYMSYQIIATWQSRLFSYQGNSILFKIVENIGRAIQEEAKISIILIIIALFILLLYLVIPTISQGALIALCARINNGQDVKLINGISYGLLPFLPMFKYHLIIKSFGLLAILTELSFIGRNLGWLWLKILLIPIFVFMIFAFFLLILFTYTDYFIVIDDDDIFPAIKRSSSLVVKHWPETFIIGILMMIITARIIVNLILVILIPALIILPAGYFATIILGKIGIIIAIAIITATILFASYFAAILEVFATFVWVKTFLYLTTKADISPREGRMG